MASSSACVINGKQCTACCRAIILKLNKHDVSEMAKHKTGDAFFVRKNWIPISKRRAKKKNPYIFTWVKTHPAYNKKGPFFWMCKKVTDSGCSVYESRPRVCSGYPAYGDIFGFSETVKTYPAEYRQDCTEWKIPVKNIDQQEKHRG